jgi:hypothetical protein
MWRPQRRHSLLGGVVGAEWTRRRRHSHRRVDSAAVALLSGGAHVWTAGPRVLVQTLDRPVGWGVGPNTIFLVFSHYLLLPGLSGLI